MLRYCAWCGSYQGAKAGSGIQIRENRSEVDTATICPSCLTKKVKENGSDPEFDRVV